MAPPEVLGFDLINVNPQRQGGATSASAQVTRSSRLSVSARTTCRSSLKACDAPDPVAMGGACRETMPLHNRQDKQRENMETHTQRAPCSRGAQLILHFSFISVEKASDLDLLVGCSMSLNNSRCSVESHMSQLHWPKALGTAQGSNPRASRAEGSMLYAGMKGREREGPLAGTRKCSAPRPAQLPATSERVLLTTGKSKGARGHQGSKGKGGRLGNVRGSSPE